MSWRVIEQGPRRWKVSVVAEKQAPSANWTLVFCFRSPGARSVWIPTEIASPSRAAIYIYAERMTDEAILGLLAGASRDLPKPLA